MPQRGVNNIFLGTAKWCGKRMDTNGSFWTQMGHLKFSVNFWNHRGASPELCQTNTKIDLFTKIVDG